MNLIAFHFIRPWWLLALVPAAVIAVILWRQRDSSRIWGRIIAKDLLPHLTGTPTSLSARRIRRFSAAVSASASIRSRRSRCIPSSERIN